jgi:hypothetical protein
VRAIHSDNGGEYIAEQLQEWLRERSIAHTYSAPYKPQQNGTAERLNRTLMEKARAMLQDADLPDSYWPDAVSLASCLRNVVPQAGSDVTPWEAFHGAKPDVSDLHTFGCRVYVRTPAVQQHKLGPHAEPGTYLGPQRSTAAHRAVINGRIVTSSDVTFDEDIRGPASRRAGTPFGSASVGGGSASAGGGSTSAGSPNAAGEAPRRPATRSQKVPLIPPLAPVSGGNSSGGGGESLRNHRCSSHRQTDPAASRPSRAATWRP